MNTHLQQLQTLSLEAISRVDRNLYTALECTHKLFNQTLELASPQVQEHFSDLMCDELVSFIHNILPLVKKQ